MNRGDPVRKALPLLATLAGALVVFGVWGNATRGYYHTASLFLWWFLQWINPASEDEHAWLILLLAVGLCVRNLTRWRGGRETPVETSSWAALAGALLLHAVAYRAEQPRVSVCALLLFLWAGAGLCGGRRWRDSVTFPLGFMVFAIPVNALDTVGFWLRLLVVRCGEALAHGLGIAVVRSGTQLFSPDGRYQYDVAAACSGVRSLEAFFALACVVGYLRLGTWQRRAVLLIACVPLILAGNLARILSIIVAAQVAGQAWGERLHAVMGVGVFVVVILGVMVVASWLETPEPAPPADGGPRGPARVVGAGSPVWRASVIACLCAFEGLLLSRVLPDPGRAGIALSADGKEPADLPAFVGTRWMGRRVPTTDAERTILPADTGFAKRLYLDGDSADPGHRVLASVVLSGADRSSIHRPELCLIGQGWSIDSASYHEFTLPGASLGHVGCTLLDVHRDVRTPRGILRVPEVMVYWFVGAERTAASYPGLLVADIRSRLTQGTSDRWAYVLFEAAAVDGREPALARIQSLLSGLGSVLAVSPRTGAPR